MQAIRYNDLMRKCLFVFLALSMVGCASITPALPAESVATDMANLPPVQNTATDPDPCGHGWQAASGSLLLCLSVADMQVIVASPLVLIGQATPDSVLTVNENIILVDETGTFSIELPLEDGPNILEITASNTTGDQIEAVITIVLDESQEVLP